MAEAYEPSKVVNLHQRLEPGHPRGGELLQAVRDIATRRLQQLLGQMFEHVDDALFDLAEKAENNAAQMHYFDGMREVRRRRLAIERSYLSQVTRMLGPMPVAPRATTAPSASGELSLVADDELEESLAVTSMASKNEARLAQELHALNQRLGVICGGIKLDESNSPLAPAALAEAFRQAMGELEADVRVKLLIYKLFDRYVMAGLDALYPEINAELMRAGVLPQFRQGARHAAPEHAAAGAASAVAAGGQDAGAAEDVLETLSQLFNARRGRAPTAPPPAAAAPAPSVHELLGALSVLQSQLADHASPVPASTGAQQSAADAAALKSLLMSQLGALRGARPSAMAGMDEDTIDLVGMLFEFILADDTLPPTMQALLARLQIPYLKAALLDRRLFAQRQHPARRLLDMLAELAKGWSPEADRDHRVFDRVKSVVERLLHDFDDDLGLFERLCGELAAFQETLRRRAELAEQRVAEATHGRERLELARRRAAREILDRIGGRALPPLVHGVLARAWANYLVLTLLRQGEDSLEFSEALRFVDEFIASTLPVRDAESRQTLRQLMPRIERSLRRGLASVAFQESDIERLLAQLTGYYRERLGEAPAQAASSMEGPLPIPDSIQPIVEQEAPALQAEREAATAPPPEIPQLEQVYALKPGTWLEFCPTGAPAERAKLSWISPMSGRYLFVNRRGLKVADYAPHELAAALAAGSARVLPAEPLFDRALDAIVDRLSQPPGTPAA